MKHPWPIGNPKYPLEDLLRNARLGTQQVEQSYFLAVCPECGWTGSSSQCIGGQDECLCPRCPHVQCQEQADAKAVFNMMLERLYEGKEPPRGDY